MGEEPAWKAACRAKRQSRDALLPKEWLLPSSPPASQLDVSRLPSECGLLTLRELEATGIDECDALLAAIASRQYTSLEVTTAFCKRATIAQQLTNCLTEVLFESAIARAKELDEHLARTGHTVGPLHGLPISLKDQFAIRGVELTMGFASWIGNVSEEDSVLAQILRRAGAVFYCRTNVPQTLINAETDNHVFGQTVNPHNRSLTCGGSSGGEGALIGLGGSILGVGTDIGGSVRIPAYCQGLFGMKPSTRRIPYHGAANFLVGLEGIQSAIGPLARSVESCATFMRAVLAGRPHELDPNAMDLPWREHLYRLEDKGGRLSFGFMVDNGIARPHPPILRACRMVREALEAAGHEVFDWEPPVPHQDIVDLAVEIIAAVRNPNDRELALSYAQELQADFDQVAKASGETRMQKSSAQRPRISVWDSWQVRYGLHLGESFRWVALQLVNRRDRFRKAYLDAWQATATRTATGRPIDGLITPASGSLAWPLKMEERSNHGYLGEWNLLDYPACVFPVTKLDPKVDVVDRSFKGRTPMEADHWSKYTPEHFLNAPVCLQVVGPRHQDEAVLGMTGLIVDCLKRAWGAS